MLVWVCEDASSILAELGVPRRIVEGFVGRVAIVPNKLSAAMVGAFKAVGGRVSGLAEISYAQWQQYAVCALQAVVRRPQARSAGPSAEAPIRAVSRVKSFFVAQKVNGRNAP